MKDKLDKTIPPPFHWIVFALWALSALFFLNKNLGNKQNGTNRYLCTELLDIRCIVKYVLQTHPNWWIAKKNPPAKMYCFATWIQKIPYSLFLWHPLGQYSYFWSPLFYCEPVIFATVTNGKFFQNIDSKNDNRSYKHVNTWFSVFWWGIKHCGLPPVQWAPYFGKQGPLYTEGDVITKKCRIQNG